VTDKPLRRKRPAGRYRRLPTGSHGLDPELVRRDQRQRLLGAMAELIALKGYPAVRISDLSGLAHVSPPTLYSLYADKEQLFIGAYEDVARRTGEAIVAAVAQHQSFERRLPAAMRAFCELAASEPYGVSLLVLGALGAGPGARGRRREVLAALEAFIHVNRAPGTPRDGSDLTVTALLGGIREVTAARLRDGRQQELPALADPLADWVRSYPPNLPAGLAAPAPESGEGSEAGFTSSARARRAEGRLPSGRSELSRQYIVKSQRERIVDATAAIVAEKGLPALTIPEIVRRANVSNQTFYSIYDSKNDAFLGAQKVGMHQALQVTIEAYRAREDDWPQAVAGGLHALVRYLASEPAHAHLTLVDTFAASPQAIATRESAMVAFRAYLGPGFRRAPELPPLIAEAVVGGIWQVLHHYIERDCVEELPGVAPQLTYFALAPFLGAERAASAALAGVPT
jgi:AcrR family transcriptional regulator